MSRTRDARLEEKVRSEYVVDETRNCDNCKRQIFEDPDFVLERNFANVLEVYLNPEECVSSRFRRDYCDNCLEPIWEKISELIGANPEDISGSDFHDD